jgi:hypothetical protein
MRRFGIYGRSSCQGDQLLAASCGERYCVGGMTADGFIRNIQRVLSRLNIVGRRELSPETAKRPPRSDSLTKRKV